MTTLICDCNQTLPLNAKALGASLNETLTPATLLCRRQAGDFVRAVQSGEPLVVACTQEQGLFTELAQQTHASAGAAASWAPIRFVNIRETAGWSTQGAQATPKMAALLAAARLPDPEPARTVTYKSAGRLLIVGPLDQAHDAALALSDTWNITLMADGPGARGGPQQRRFAVLGGRMEALSGWLGAFELRWSPSNPIDLDLCTRCNACVVACPEDAIGLDYQVDLQRCSAHRDCVKACGVAGAIDFARQPETQVLQFDAVLDLRTQALAFNRHALPQGYVSIQRTDWSAALLHLRGLVGEFEKPRFFDYKAKLCAHSRNAQVGCQACIDVCSAQAISSDTRKQQIQVNPYLCVGCGTCTTVCPTGALSYVYPRVPDLGVRIKTLLSTYAQAGGHNAVVLLHSQQAGQSLVDEVGRAARLGVAQGLPAQVMGVPLWHAASVGLEVWLSALAMGARQVWVLTTQEDAPQYLDALDAQIAQAQAIWQGLGYAGRCVQRLHAQHLSEFDAELQRAVHSLSDARASALPVARYAWAADKRTTLSFALDHLLAHAPVLQPGAAGVPQQVSLPAAGAAMGSVTVQRDACTLCMSCVSACPASALQDNTQAPQLRFLEKNCVQCGLCVTTCPENALSLEPRLLLTPERAQLRVLNETQPFACVRCGKAFGTRKGIEAMLARLGAHAMFQGAAQERLKMCGDCRVIDLYSSDGENTIL